MSKINALVLGFLLMLAIVPASASAGCGACPTDKAKAASGQKVCPTGCQKPCCNPDAESGEHQHDHDHNHDHGHGEGHEGHEGHAH